MANKRMFAKEIIRSDEFLKLKPIQQILYIQLNLEADDEGVVNNSQFVMNIINARQSDLNALIDNKFVLIIDKLVVIKHFFINNTLRNDRAKLSLYHDKLNNIYLGDDKIYHTTDNQMTTKWEANGSPNIINLSSLILNNNNNKELEYKEIIERNIKKIGKELK